MTTLLAGAVLGALALLSAQWWGGRSRRALERHADEHDVCAECARPRDPDECSRYLERVRVQVAQAHAQVRVAREEVARAAKTLGELERPVGCALCCRDVRGDRAWSPLVGQVFCRACVVDAASRLSL